MQEPKHKHARWAALASPTGHAAALDLFCNGGFEAQAQALMGDLQQALNGLSEPQLNLAPLQSLVSRPTDWTTRPELRTKARDLAADWAQQVVSADGVSGSRSVAEIQRDIDDTHSMLSLVGGLAEHRRARLQSEADGFIAELHARQESEQQAAAFAGGQALRIQEVREMLKAEIELLGKGCKQASLARFVMGNCRLFLEARAHGGSVSS